MNDGKSTTHKSYTVMPLSDINIKNTKPLDKPIKMPDGNGMYVLVHPNGGNTSGWTTALTASTKPWR